MGILKKIRRKWHNDIFDILSMLKDKLDFLIHGHEQMEQKEAAVIDKIDSLTERTEIISSQINKTTDKLDQIGETTEKLNLMVDTMRKLDYINHVMEKTNQIDGVVAQLDLMIAKQNAADEIAKKTISSIDNNFAIIRNYGEEIATNSNSIFSYCNNEAIRQSDGFRMTDIYSYYKRLHELTTINTITTHGVQKTRVGRKHDGGYVMIEPFSATKIAYSLGIADDVSWDEAMADYGYEIYQYDHTIEGLPKERAEFHWKKLGLTGREETEDLKHLGTLVHDNGHDECSGMLLKMDIENYEWDVLNYTDKDVLDRFDQIVMEIHGLNNLNQSQRTLEVLEKLSQSFTTVHIHANNYRYAAFCENYITPDVMEITMVKTSLYDFDTSKTALMNTIDQVNRAGSQDIWIGKW